MEPLWRKHCLLSSGQTQLTQVISGQNDKKAQEEPGTSAATSGEGAHTRAYGLGIRNLDCAALSSMIESEISCN